MEILCTRPGCPRPQNFFVELDDPSHLKTVQQKYCTSCGMPLILAGRYLPSKLLGRGGFGAAFLARDRYTPTMRQCVVKQFQPADNLAPAELAIARDLFEREASVLEKLGNKHEQIPDLYAFFPLIVPTIDGKTQEQFFYIVQEFINGKNLEQELAIKGKFSETEVRSILEEMLKLLQFVHDNNSIHRDIKPSNIMRDEQGLLYLLDFGAVKEVTAAENPYAKSTGIYSMGFAPPEQMASTQVYPSTDLYALASTCVNLLTGKPTQDMYDVYANQLNWKPYAPETSDRLTNILNIMLQSAPKDRFQSATEVLQALNYPTTLPNQPQAQTQPVKATKPPLPVKIQPKFSLLEILSSAAFTGWEAALLFIALRSFFPTLAIQHLGLWGLSVFALIIVQYFRIIEKIDFLIIAVISISLFVFIPFLHAQIAIKSIIILSALSAAGAISITALFRLIFILLSQLLSDKK